MSEELFPVCAPRLAAGLKTPADLANATLLHDELREDWGMWFAAAVLPAGAGALDVEPPIIE
jgi:hypothetical protein